MNEHVARGRRGWRSALIALPLLAAWAMPAAAEGVDDKATLPQPPDDEFDPSTDGKPAAPPPAPVAEEADGPVELPATEAATTAELAATKPPPVEDTPAPPAPAPVAPAPRPAAKASAATEQLAARHTLAREDRARPRFGTMVDVGLPDGATVSIVYRPIRALRLAGGVSHNFVSLGQRVGASFVPFDGWVSPTLSVEYGRYAEGNANPLARMVSGDPTFSSSTLDRVGYQYANARLGLELGRKWFTFFLHAGASYVNGNVHNLSAATMSETSGNTSVAFSADPTVHVWSVSARLGFVIYLAK